MNYHVGETVLSLQKTTLIPGGSESLVYTTLSGGIGILVPFTSHEVGAGTSLPGVFAPRRPNASVLSRRTTTSSSTWRCTCAPSSPPCAAETTSASGPTTSPSRWVSADAPSPRRTPRPRPLTCLVCAERDRRRPVRAVQQHGPPQAEERGRGAGQDAARGVQEAGGHPHPLRLLSSRWAAAVLRDALSHTAVPLSGETAGSFNVWRTPLGGRGLFL